MRRRFILRTLKLKRFIFPFEISGMPPRSAVIKATQPALASAYS